MDLGPPLFPTATLTQLSVVGLTAALPPVEVVAVPRPVSATVCGLPLAESVNLSEAVRVPAAVGAKTMVAVQVADAATLVPQVLLKISKSPALAPEMAMQPMEIEAEPELLNVTALGPPFTPTATLFQARLAGETPVAARQAAACSANAIGMHLRSDGLTKRIERY